MSEIEDLKKQLALLTQNLLESKNEIYKLERELNLNKQKLSNSNSKITDFTDAIPFSVFEIYENGQLIF
jgi:predicted  nucleic acid-binding Zn-ribbon protein